MTSLTKQLVAASLVASFCVGILVSGGAKAQSKRAATPDRTDAAPEKSERHAGKLSSDLKSRLKVSGRDGRVPVILQVKGQPSDKLNALLNRSGVNLKSHLKKLDSMVVELPASAVEELSAMQEVGHVSLDREVGTLGHVTSTTGTDLVRTQPAGSLLGGLLTTNQTTLDGTGIGIAIVDSGIDAGHKAFAATLSLSGSRIKFKKDFTTENVADKDRYGHGAHVASSAAGVSTASGGAYEGIARNADIISLKVLDSTGMGKTSDLLNALNWILSPADPTKPLSNSNPTNATKYNIRVVNLSLGAPAIESYKDDPVCQAVRRLVDAGIVVVAAAGNNGKDTQGNKVYGLIHSPGDEPSAITVGATNTLGTDARSDDGITTYSSRGPTRGFSTDASGVRHYDNLIKPDLVAPGNKLIYAEADDGGSNPNLLVKQNPQLDSGITDNDNKKLMYLSGTSMATPLVAGTAALMLQANPKLTPNMVKMILMYTAQPLAGYNTLEQGAGELNVEGAVRLAKLVRTDLTNNTSVGSPLLTTSTLPTPQTTIAGQTFQWSQAIVLDYNLASGSNLISQYQKVYGTGYTLGDGATLGGTGILMSDGFLMSDGILMNDGILMADGAPWGGQSVFLGSGILMSDGILMADGFLMSDGMLTSDGIMMSDGILMSDSYIQAQSAMTGGDDTPCMPAIKGGR